MSDLSMVGLGGVAAAPATNEQKIRDAAQGFEVVLLRQMMREMRQSSLSGSSSGINAGYLQMGDEQLASHLAQAGGLGFGKAMANQMLQQIRQSQLIANPQSAVKR